MKWPEGKLVCALRQGGVGKQQNKIYNVLNM